METHLPYNLNHKWQTEKATSSWKRSRHLRMKMSIFRGTIRLLDEDVVRTTLTLCEGEEKKP